jgi:pimeloyl-ACP methyl ester carboxylesterase
MIVSLLSISVLAVALICGMTYLAFNHNIESARQRVSGRSQTVQTSVGIVEYATAGDGQPILVVHGSAGGFDQGLDMTAAVAEHGFLLIVPSRFGYLRTSMPANASPALQADSFAELLDKFGHKKVALLAISAGAWSALEFAVRHPDRCRALILLVPAQALPPGVPNYGGPIVGALFDSNFLTWLASKLMRIAPTVVGPTMFGTPASVVRSALAEERSRLRQTFDHLLPITERSSGMKLDIKTAAAPVALPLEKITCPVLAISAADDQFGTAARAQAIAQAVSNGKTVIYPSGGHALVGRRAETVSEFTSFLASNP